MAWDSGAARLIAELEGGGLGSVESKVRVCALTVGMRLLLTKLGLCDGTWKREDSTTAPSSATTSPGLSARGWI